MNVLNTFTNDTRGVLPLYRYTMYFGVTLMFTLVTIVIAFA